MHITLQISTKIKRRRNLLS